MSRVPVQFKQWLNFVSRGVYMSFWYKPKKELASWGEIGDIWIDSWRFCWQSWKGMKGIKISKKKKIIKVYRGMERWQHSVWGAESGCMLLDWKVGLAQTEEPSNHIKELNSVLWVLMSSQKFWSRERMWSELCFRKISREILRFCFGGRRIIV